MRKIGVIVGLFFILGMWVFNILDNEVQLITSYIPVIGYFIGITISLIYEFLIGAYLYINSETFKIIWNNKILVAGLVVVFSIIYYCYWWTGIEHRMWVMHSPVIGLCVPWLTIFIGLSFAINRIKNDISYEIFLYHMIVISILKWKGIQGTLGIILTIVITPIVALLVYNFFEKKILEYKK